jgi:Heterokaryon incompatibility protein (HET)
MSDLEASGRETPDPGTETPLSSHHSGGQGGAARRRIAKAVNRLTDALDRKNTYAYKNIDCDKEIRVLQLYPGAPRSPLLCCLIPCPLLDQNVQPISIDPKTIPYAALSYYWGDEEPEHEIYIFETPAAYDDWKDKRAILLPWMGHLLIRNNLRDALEQLRLEDKPVYLWADALCINQSNVKERTAQVARMHDVYTQAEKVYIWLGKRNPIEAQRVFDFLRKILDLSELENLVERLETQRGSWEDDRRDCKLTIDLMKAKWFSVSSRYRILQLYTC